jgi:hypothetical protein
VLALLLVSGCSTKKYVRSQTGPLIQHTNELDDQTAKNNRNLKDLDERHQQGAILGRCCAAECAAGKHRFFRSAAERAGSREPRRLTG